MTRDSIALRAKLAYPRRRPSSAYSGPHSRRPGGEERKKERKKERKTKRKTERKTERKKARKQGRKKARKQESKK